MNTRYCYHRERLSTDPDILNETLPQVLVSQQHTCSFVSLINISIIIAGVCKMVHYFVQFDEFQLYTSAVVRVATDTQYNDYENTTAKAISLKRDISSCSTSCPFTTARCSGGQTPQFHNGHHERVCDFCLGMTALTSARRKEAAGCSV